MKLEFLITCLLYTSDIGIMRDFIKAIREENINTRTSALRSIESHIMAFAAEESRLTRCIVDIDRFFNLK